MRLAKSLGRSDRAADAPDATVPAPRTRPQTQLLGEILVRHGSLSRSQLEDALSKLPGSGMPIW